MKAGLAINAFVIAALKTFAAAPAPVTALFTADEEIGSPSSKELIMREARAARAVFNSEPGRPGGGVVTGRKGGVFMRLDVTGKAAHAGNNYGDGISAIEEIAQKIIRLHALTDLPNGISCNVGTISGGQTVNTVAPNASAEIDLRFIKPADRTRMMAAIEAIVAESFVPGTKARLEITGEFEPMVASEASQRLYDHYAACAARSRPDRRADVRRRLLRCRLRVERRRTHHLRRRSGRRPRPFARRISGNRFDRAAGAGTGARNHEARGGVMSKRTPLQAIAILIFALAFAAPARAAKCGGDFNTFISAMGREATAAGVSRPVIDSAFAGLTPDAGVLAFDRRQRGTFRKSFEEYAATRVIPARINRAKQLMQRNGALLARIEQEFGVPKTLLMAIWTMESDNGTGDMGKLPVVRTVATMAHDCRRTDLFQGELLAALQILQRGDLSQRDLVGAYAGEIGQTQFLPSSYIKYGVDYDGNGHVDLRHSVPDVLASTANLLKTNGWRAGAPFGEGTPNFEVMREWNRSVIYRKTLVLFSERLGGA